MYRFNNNIKIKLYLSSSPVPLIAVAEALPNYRCQIQSLFTTSTMSSSSLPTTPSSPPSPPLHDSSQAESRLREAEDRLREAIEEVQRRQRRAAAGGPLHHPPCHHAGDESCVANAIGNLCQSFLLSYGVRVGIGILLRAFKLVRRQSYSSLLDLKVHAIAPIITRTLVLRLAFECRRWWLRWCSLGSDH